MDPLTSNEQNWTVQTAEEAFSKIKHYVDNRVHAISFTILGALVGGIALAAGSTGIGFTAVVITGLTIAYAIYCKSKIASMRQNLHEQGLTSERQTELGLSLFQDALKEIKELTSDNFFSFWSRVNTIFEGILSIHQISPNYDRLKLWVVEEKPLVSDTKLSLLKMALSKRMELYFSSLQQLTPNAVSLSSLDERYKKFAREAIRESALLSAQFVNNCLESGTDLDIDAINRQLKALAPKFYKEINKIETAQTLYPTVQVRQDKDHQLIVELTANVWCEFLGAEGKVGDLIEILNREGITIEVVGEGWKYSDRNIRDHEVNTKWDTYMNTLALKFLPSFVDKTSKVILPRFV